MLLSVAVPESEIADIVVIVRGLFIEKPEVLPCARKTERIVITVVRRAVCTVLFLEINYRPAEAPRGVRGRAVFRY